MLRFTNSLTLAAISAVALHACVVEVSYDVRGTAVDLEASWTINGVLADQASCDAAGIDTVGLVFLDGTSEYRYPEFVFECEAGSVLALGVLRRGTYSAYWESYDASGTALQQSAEILIDADNVDDLARPDIPDFSSTVVGNNDAVLSVSWDSNIATDIDAVDCDTIEGVNFIAYALHNNDTNELIQDFGAMAGCADQITIPGETLEVGTAYRVDIDGGPEDGSWYWQGSCFFTAEEGGTTATCEAADVRYRLAVDLVWDSNEGAAFAAADCEGAGVEFMNYELRPEGGSAIVSEMQIACGNSIIFEEPLVTDGQTYELTLVGHDDDTYGGEWTLLCVGLTAGTGLMENGACEIERG